MNNSDFYYELPEELIAQTPLQKRDTSRLMLLDKRTGQIQHSHFYNLPDFLKKGDCLVMNDSRVLPARLIGRKKYTGGHIELLLLRNIDSHRWECLVKPGKKIKMGTKLVFGDNELEGTIVDVIEGGNRIVEFKYSGIFMEILEKLGKTPLPPYIKKELDDPERYQTVYSKELGSAAAPTAGLHFTKELLSRVEENGVKICYLTLHVGLGTFRPVKETQIEEHLMHSEFCTISKDSAEIVNSTIQDGGRIISVGTTSCRTLESFADGDGYVQPGSHWTDIFIYPGYQFKIVNALITNFHLPESTLIMLVSALAGRENILNAYHVAVNERYRFFSFGDAMFIR